MKISSSAYMAVESMARLATYSADAPCTTQGLAEWISRSAPYTETLMGRLRAAGLIKAVRGPGGRYYLSRPADRITVADIFQAFDEPRRLMNRPLNAVTLEAEAIQNLHGADLLWELLRSCILLLLNGVSLADIAPETADPTGVDGGYRSAVFRAEMQSTARH